MERSDCGFGFGADFARAPVAVVDNCHYLHTCVLYVYMVRFFISLSAAFRRMFLFSCRISAKRRVHFWCGVHMQEILYKPVGLSCGHVFCKLCLLRSANIVHKFNMEFKKMNNHFKCPCCRQDGELKLAVELVSLNDMIRRRFTSGWMEQECSANAELQKLRKIRHYSYKLIQRRIISAAPHAFIHSQ